MNTIDSYADINTLSKNTIINAVRQRTQDIHCLREDCRNLSEILPQSVDIRELFKSIECQHQIEMPLFLLCTAIDKLNHTIDQQQSIAYNKGLDTYRRLNKALDRLGPYIDNQSQLYLSRLEHFARTQLNDFHCALTLKYLKNTINRITDSRDKFLQTIQSLSPQAIRIRENVVRQDRMELDALLSKTFSFDSLILLRQALNENEAEREAISLLIDIIELEENWIMNHYQAFGSHRLNVIKGLCNIECRYYGKHDNR